MTDPGEAYKAAKAARESREKAESSEASRIASLPERASAKLSSISEALKIGLPSELSLDREMGPGGHEGSRGVSSVLMQLREENKIVAQMVFTCRDDEIVVCKGFPPDRDKRPEKALGQFPLHLLDEAKAKKMLSDLITHYLS